MAVAIDARGQAPRAAREPSGQDSEMVDRAILAAQAGEMQAFAFLYARYADRLLHYLQSVVGDKHEAEDLTQQTFAKLIAVIGKYEPRAGIPFFGWLGRVALNLARDGQRARRCVPCAEIREDSDTEVFSRGNVRELRAALAELPSDQREVLILRHLAGLSPGEIAIRTGRSESSIHGLHHRGRRALQADLRSRGLAPATVGALGAEPKARAVRHKPGR